MTETAFTVASSLVEGATWHRLNPVNPDAAGNQRKRELTGKSNLIYRLLVAGDQLCRRFSYGDRVP